MTNTKHTPGPWIYGCEIGTDSTRIETESGKVIGAIRTRSITSWENNSHPIYSWDEEGAANARLIAAAPELLRSLLAIVESLSDQDDEGMIEHAQQMIDARAAIAKATRSAA